MAQNNMESLLRPGRRGPGREQQSKTVIAISGEQHGQAASTLSNNNTKEEKFFTDIQMVSTQEPKRLPRSQLDTEAVRNDPLYKPGPYQRAHTYAVQMRKQPHEVKAKRYAKSEYIIKWRENQNQTLSVKITDPTDLTHPKSKKLEDIKDVEHLMIEDEDRTLKALPQSLTSLKKIFNLSVKYSRIKAVPQWMSSMTHVIHLAITETHLSKLEVILSMTHLKTLDLSRNKITAIPKQVQNLTALAELNLAGNSIAVLPGEIQSLQKLTKLDLSSNVIQFLPNEICNLKGLRSFDIGRNIIEKLPEAIGQMEALSYLCMSHNRLSILPMSVQHLRSLKLLNVANNKIRVLQKGLQHMVSLEQLNARNNAITDIEDFPQLVKTVLLDCNSIKDIEIVAHRAERLEVLSVKDNDLSNIPRSLTEKRSLKALYIDGNPVENIPAEIGQNGQLRHLTLNNTNIRTLPGNLSSGRNRLSLLDVQDTKMTAKEIQSSTKGIDSAVVTNNLKRSSRHSAEMSGAASASANAAGEED